MNLSRSVKDDGAATEGFFEPFDLSVNLGPDAIPWLSATSRVGSLHGIPRRAGSSLPDLLDMVYDYTDAIQFAEMQPNPQLSEILGNLVFGDPMLLQLFQATRGVAADRGRQLLVRILASPHLSVLPWELLPDPAAGHSGQGPRYLALAPDTHLVRLARGLTYPARAALLEAPLNLLIVLSSPTSRDYSEDLAFDIFEVKRGLLAELSPLVQAGMLHIDVEDQPTLDNLRRRIGAQRRGYHLFHYVGHALPGKLIIEDRAGRREDVASSQIMEILRLCPDLRLAVFAGCETARPDRDPASVDPQAGWRDLLSLADYCVQEACPAVIGMQAVLPFGTERVFTRFFYQALASGYSVSEAMRLARGAIHGDERLGRSLLDWSVPALFVGSSEPGALVPRSAPPFKPASSAKPWELKLGLRQSGARFFARELPLRQAVDIMTGQTPERVLLITGAAGVGKTSLVDRVLEELGDKVTHVLYVYFDRLAPEVVDACSRLDAEEMPDLLSKLAGLKPDHALNRLCLLASELLRYSRITTRARDSKWSIGEWWERILEDLVQHRFVLVVDEIGLLDRLQHGLLEKLIEPWLAERVDSDLKATSEEQLIDNLQRQLSWLPELEKYLTDVPKRLRDEIPLMLGDLLDRLVVTLSYDVTTKASAEKANMKVEGKVKPRGHIPDSLFNNVIAALKALEEVRMSLGAALRLLAERRSNVRILLTAGEKPRNFLDLPEDRVFEMRLAHLTWPETWRLIRRNLPALLSYGDVYLSRLWSRLGPRLDQWEELERRVLHEHGKIELQELAKQIAPRSSARPVGTGTLLHRRGQRPLRIAVVGPLIAGSSAMAEAITRLAIEHGIGGRVVEFDEAGALASLIDEPSPFADWGVADKSAILEWLQRILKKQPDIILLDYEGSTKSPEDLAKTQDTDPERILLRSMQYGSLLIAAGGNLGIDSAEVSTPSGYSEVLGVGPLDNDGKLRPYAEWHAEFGKPDFFMADDLAATALAAALKPEVLSRRQDWESQWGSSFSALHAVAAATLVWSILPELSPRGIRALLVEASKPIAEGEYPRSLTMKDAIASARVSVVERTLKAGVASLQTLSAITGLEEGVLSATLESLIERERVVRLSSGRLERFQLTE